MEQGPLEEAYLRFLSGETDAFDSIMTELHIPLIRFIQRYVKNVSRKIWQRTCSLKF